MHYAAPPIVGGVESVLAQHARLMRAAGHRVRVIAGRGNGLEGTTDFYHIPLVDSLHPRVLEAKRKLDRGQVPRDFDPLAQELEASLRPAVAGVSVLVAHNVCSLHKNLALTAALREMGAAQGAPRLIAWHHDLAWTTPRYRPELHDGWPWNLIREDWPEVRPRHVVVSELRRRELAALMGLPLEEITVVPSGLDLAAFLKLEAQTVELVNRLSLGKSCPLLLLPVRITRRKNIELAIRVTAFLGRTFPGATLVVTGPPGPHNPDNHAYFRWLKELRAELGLAPPARPAVHFLTEVQPGFLPDSVITDLYRLADALLLPSREEGFGIPALEAGLTGLPIFCADIPALREIAGDSAAYFSPDADPVDVADMIEGTLGQSATFQLRGHVRRHYSWERVYVEKIEPLLEEPPP